MVFPVFANIQQFKKGSYQRIFFGPYKATFMQPVYVFGPKPYCIMTPLAMGTSACYEDISCNSETEPQIVGVKEIGCGTPLSFVEIRRDENGILASFYSIVGHSENTLVAVKTKSVVISLFDIVCPFNIPRGDGFYTRHYFGAKISDNMIIFQDEEVIPLEDINADCVSVKDCPPEQLVDSFATMLSPDVNVHYTNKFADVFYNKDDAVVKLAFDTVKTTLGEVKTGIQTTSCFQELIRECHENYTDVISMYMAKEIGNETVLSVVNQAVANISPSGSDMQLVSYVQAVKPYNPTDYDDNDIIAHGDDIPDASKGSIISTILAAPDLELYSKQDIVCISKQDYRIVPLYEDDEGCVFKNTIMEKCEETVFNGARCSVLADAMFSTQATEFGKRVIASKKRKALALCNK